MGCYGIGVSRVVAAAIEQNFDDRGITWPEALAPFRIGIVPMNAQKSPEVAELSEKLYADLQAKGIEVYIDDRDKKTSPGVKFADMDLMGIPHRIVISDRGLKNGTVEYKARNQEDKQDIAADDMLDFVLKAINN